MDSKAYLAAALWCCGFVKLWLWQFTVLLFFGFVLSYLRGALADVLGSYNFVSVPNATDYVQELALSSLCPGARFKLIMAKSSL